MKRTPTTKDIPTESQRVKGLQKETENKELEVQYEKAKARELESNADQNINKTTKDGAVSAQTVLIPTRTSHLLKRIVVRES